jgi:plasmid stabilization system protein ParE
MPNYQVRLAPRAQSQIDEVSAWWRANRPAAANLVADELEAAVDRIASAPSSGTVYRQVEFRSVRRVLLPRIRYHVYYDIDEAKQLVRIWGCPGLVDTFAPAVRKDIPYKCVCNRGSADIMEESAIR